MNHHSIKQSQEFTLEDITNILKKYKWSIIFITLITFLLGSAYLYFKTPMYLSYSIIKVKSNEQANTNDVINNTIASARSENVLEEISLLKTYKINRKALETVDFKVRYFIEKDYKKVEIYDEQLPIEISNVQILDKEILGRTLTIIPSDNTYSIQYIPSYQEKIEKKFFEASPFTFKEMTALKYEEKIANPYFQFRLKKNQKFNQPIYVLLAGEKRDIFEQQIRSKLDVTQLEKDTSLIQISFEDSIPKRANSYIDALTKSFIEYSIESKNVQNQKTLSFITEELENIKKELKASEQNLESHQVTKNIVEPSIQASIYIKNLSDIDIEISENKLKKKLIINLINFVRNNYNLDAIAPSISKLDDENTLALITRLQDQQILEEELTQEYTDEYPKLKSTRKQISTIRNKIIHNLKGLQTNIDYENETLSKRKKSYEKDMQTLPSKERELVNIKRNYEVKSAMYEYLLKKQAENKIIQLATFSDYQIIDNAYNSDIPIKPKKAFILFLSAILGLLLGLVYAFLRHTKNRYIHSRDELQNLTSLPIYGSIPYQRQKKHEISVYKTAKSPFSESFRTLRTNLQFINQNNTSNTILITSTVPSEGKSTTAANLAAILEMAKYKTILINFDLRKPTLHKFFNISNEKGLDSYLNGLSSIEEIIQTTEFANLDIIGSGAISHDPSELILSKELPKLFTELKKMYDYIIIDTAPIGIVNDTNILMQYADLNLIMIREDYAKKEFIATLEEMIEKYKFKNIGLLLNASKAKGGEYGYGYSYEYKA
jgi:capsular exopolysaccharide synthesis family protein